MSHFATTAMAPSTPAVQSSTIDKLARQDAAHLALDQANAGPNGFADQVASTAIFYMGAAVAASDNPQRTLNALHVALGMTTVADTTGRDLVTPASSERRIVPALVRAAGDRTMRIHVECWGWCTQDHMGEVLAIEDISHSSASVCLEVDSLTDPKYPTHALSVGLYANPASPDERLRAPHLVVANEASPEDASLDADMGEALADQMITVAQEIRRLARTAREATA